MLSSCMRCTCSLKGQWTSLHANQFRRYSVYMSSPGPTHYDILEIGRQATSKEIKKAYITLCRKIHPDANPGDPGAQQKFVRLQEAYNILSNPRDRANYDVQMYKELRERAKSNQTPKYSTTHSTENLSEQETIQRFYRQHQEQYEEWVRKTRQQNNNNRSNNNNNYYYDAWQGQTSRGQHHYSNSKEWWGDLNPNDPHYEIKSKIFQYLNRLTAADLFLFTAFGKVASLFMMMFFIFFQCRKKS